MTVVRMLPRVLYSIGATAAALSTLLIFLLMLLVTADVVGRYVFNSPLPGTFEISESAMVFVVFLAFAHAEARGQNIRISLLTSRLSLHQQAFFEVLAALAGMFLFGLIGWQTWGPAVESWAIREYMSGPAPLPIYPSKLVLPVGSFLLVTRFAVSLVSAAVKLLDKEWTGEWTPQ